MKTFKDDIFKLQLVLMVTLLADIELLSNNNKGLLIDMKIIVSCSLFLKYLKNR